MDIETPQQEDTPQAEETIEPAPHVSNRFLFVDIAALRAKQLRRGARPRLDTHRSPRKPPSAAQSRTRGDGRGSQPAGAVRFAAGQASRQPRRPGCELPGRHRSLVVGCLLAFGASSVFILVLFLGFCIIFGFPKLRRHNRVDGGQKPGRNRRAGSVRSVYAARCPARARSTC